MPEPNQPTQPAPPKQPNPPTPEPGRDKNDDGKKDETAAPRR